MDSDLRLGVAVSHLVGLILCTQDDMDKITKLLNYPCVPEEGHQDGEGLTFN